MTIKHISAVTLTTLAMGQTATAESLGTPAEAKEMLGRVITAMETDKTAAIAAFNAGESAYKDRDLYVYCADAEMDGVMLAHGAAPDKVVGAPLTAVKDAKGTLMADLMLPFAVEGEIATTETYWWTNPGETEPRAKQAHYTLVAGDICGVAFYN